MNIRPDILRDSLLEKLRLVKYFSVQTSKTKIEAFKNIESNIESDSFFGESFEAFSLSPKTYKGKVQKNSFILRNKRKFFNPLSGLVKIKGIAEKDKSNSGKNIIWFRVSPRVGGLGMLIIIPLLPVILVINAELEMSDIKLLSILVLFGIILELIFYLIIKQAVIFAIGEIEENAKELIN